MNGPKNLTASVKARLQNVAEKRGEEFNLVLARYGIERLLFRLSRSQYADRFLLKGAMLFAVWDDKTHRPTRDLDLLGFGPTEKEALVRVFREVVATPVPSDGLDFDPDSVRAEEIREDNTYGGVRVRLMGMLGKAHVPIQIDVGAGDAVTPAPEMAVFPVLLDFPAPHIRAYPVYTVVAEKFEAMVKLGAANTRLKDFYDLWFLAQRLDFDGPTLARALRATFDRRQTAVPKEVPAALTGRFAEDRAGMWQAFLRRNGLGPITFAEVVTVIRDFLAAPIRAAADGSDWRHVWRAGGKWSQN